MSTIKTRNYSISEAARIRLRVWTEKQMDEIRKYKANNYWGKGVDRRTGKKAKKTKK